MFYSLLPRILVVAGDEDNLVALLQCAIAIVQDVILHRHLGHDCGTILRAELAGLLLPTGVNGTDISQARLPVDGSGGCTEQERSQMRWFQGGLTLDGKVRTWSVKILCSGVTRMCLEVAIYEAA